MAGSWVAIQPRERMLWLNINCSYHSESTSLEGIELLSSRPLLLPGWEAHTSTPKPHGPTGAILNFMVTSPSPSPNTTEWSPATPIQRS